MRFLGQMLSLKETPQLVGRRGAVVAELATCWDPLELRRARVWASPSFPQLPHWDFTGLECSLGSGIFQRSQGVLMGRQVWEPLAWRK